MNASRGLGRLRWIPLAVALALPLGGCEDDTTPVITKLEANPACDVMTVHTAPTAGTWLDVTFFARASSGNRFDDPTGGNSPLEWRWNFGDGGTASNVVVPTHRYTAAGTYEVTLTVEDKDGQTASKSINVFVGEQYTDLDIVLVEAELTQTEPVFTGLDSNGSPLLTGWAATYAGHLASNCDISGLFQQYQWSWDFGDGGSVLHLDEPRHVYPPSPGSYSATLEVTELATGVARTATAQASNPAGLSVATPRYAIVGDILTLRVNGHLLQGMTDLQASLVFDDSLIALNDATPVSDLVDGGFVANVDTSTPGRIDFSFSRASGLGSAVPTIGLLDLTFEVDVIDVDYTVPLAPHELIPTGVTIESFSVSDAGADRSVGSRGSQFSINSDCNGNGRADDLDVSIDPFVYDLNQDGIVDSCQ